MATLAVFAFGTDRNDTADVVALVYSFGLFLGFTTPLWPLPSLRDWGWPRRAASVAISFMVVSYATHLSWELGWLVMHEGIASARDAAWAYPWWAYIDGGDARYARAESTLLVIETLSVINGAVGALGLWHWFRSKKTSRAAVLLCMATAVVHLYSVSLYFGTELNEGMSNVGSGWLDVWIKFGLANAPWAIFPWFVLDWGRRELGVGRR